VQTPRPESNEAGFGLIELLIAMVVLNVGLLAIVAAFSSGAVAINRAGKTGTASALADAQMEQYRTLPYYAIGLDTSGAGTAATDATYTGEAAPPNGPCVTGQATTCGNAAPDSTVTIDQAAGLTGYSCAQANPGGSRVWVRSSFPNACDPVRTISTAASPDRHTYRVDTYIRTTAASTTQRETKIVTVVVRDGSNVNGRALAREASTFDCSTGTNPSPNSSACP
jgi:type II secretory pathway pseudopilin PulG